MTADVSPGGLVLPSYGRPRGVHPPLDYSGYRSTALRHPRQPLVLLPQRLTEVTGPLSYGCRTVVHSAHQSEEYRDDR